MAYAVHTRSCTYLLDDDGICRWTLAPTGVPVLGADRFLGAQFMACLDVREPGGLVGELRVGAAALFARSEDGRLVLLRTPQIEYVEHRADDADASDAALPIAPEPVAPAYTPYVEPLPAYAPRATAAPPAYAAPPPPTAPPYRAPAYRAPEPATPAYSAPAHPRPPYQAPAYSAPAYAEPAYPAPPLGPLAHPHASAPEIELDEDPSEEIVDVEELVTFSEVTLTIPLYRPEAQAPPLPAHRVVIGPGRRLR